MSEAELKDWQARQYPILRARVAELEEENQRLREGIFRIEQTPLGGYHVQIAHNLLNP